MKVKVILLPYIFQVLYVLCFTRPRYQVSVYRTIGPLVWLCCCYMCSSILPDGYISPSLTADSIWKFFMNCSIFNRGAPRGFGDLGRRAIYFRELGSTAYYFGAAGEQAHTFGDLGSTAKK